MCNVTRPIILTRPNESLLYNVILTSWHPYPYAVLAYISLSVLCMIDSLPLLTDIYFLATHPWMNYITDTCTSIPNSNNKAHCIGMGCHLYFCPLKFMMSDFVLSIAFFSELQCNTWQTMGHKLICWIIKDACPFIWQHGQGTLTSVGY